MCIVSRLLLNMGRNFLRGDPLRSYRSWRFFFFGSPYLFFSVLYMKLSTRWQLMTYFFTGCLRLSLLQLLMLLLLFILSGGESWRAANKQVPPMSNHFHISINFYQCTFYTAIMYTRQCNDDRRSSCLRMQSPWISEVVHLPPTGIYGKNAAIYSNGKVVFNVHRALVVLLHL